MSLGLAAFQLAFQASPIILTGGAAANIPGGMLPIISLTEALNFVDGLLSGSNAFDLDNFFAQFHPMSGSTLIDNQVGQYTFANQSVAANAIIAEPLKISMLMSCPVRNDFGYAAKLATMTALKTTLDNHVQSGGTFTIATPSYFYTNCILTGLRDASSGDSNQAQNAYVFEFVKPLLTLEQAAAAENSLMSKLSGGTAISGQPAWSGLEQSVGLPPSLAGASIVPAATGAAGSAVAGVSNALGLGGP